MTVLVVPSAARLSPFRVARLLERLRLHAPGLSGMLVQDFFLLKGEADQEKLRALLGEGPATLPDGDARLFVVDV